MLDVEREQDHRGWTPWRAEPSDWRWWLAVGAVAALGVLPAFVGAWLVATLLEGVVGFEWLVLVAVGVPFALVGLLTGAIGGVTGWRLLVPTVLPYAVAAVPGDTRVWGFLIWWAVVVLGAWLGRVLEGRRTG